MENNTHLNFDIKNYLENNPIKIDNIKFQKMILLYNALEEGWTIRKKKDSFIFEKKHEGKKEILSGNFLERFLISNFDIHKLL
jgi:predicted HNH restriction endonuclease